MGNSTVALQKIVDSTRVIPQLAPMVEAGGFHLQPALDIANDVMKDMLAEKMPWKFNRIVVKPFFTISYTQDYPRLNLSNIGWIEHVEITDINNTSLPKPVRWPRAVKDLRRTSNMYGEAEWVCWLPNDQLEQIYETSWPGPNVVYTNPVGVGITPANPFPMFQDVNGNLLLLTTYGTTGASAPAAPANSAEGFTVNDGTAVWSVLNPKGQGFRISPIPSQTSVVWRWNIICQAKPIRFTTLGQLLDPIPDDYEPYFREGYIAHAHLKSPDPAIRAMGETKKKDWRATIAQATGAGDREPDSASIVPVRSAMDQGYQGDLGAGWPYGPSF